MKNFEQIGTEIGELVEVKNAAYGSSFAKSAEFLRLLYPEGVAPEQYADMLLQVRVFDKQMRIATDRDALGENPWSDVSGYGILGVHLHQNDARPTIEGRRECDGASAAATNQSKAQHDSAAINASAPTTTSASAPPAPQRSQQHDAPSAAPASVDASTATEAASRAEAASQSGEMCWKSKLAHMIAIALFTNGFGEVAERLVLTAPLGRNLGGWGYNSAVDVIERNLPDGESSR